MENNVKLDQKKSLFSSRLKKIMVEQNVKAVVLANSIGVSKQLISQYLNGKSIPRADTLTKLSSYLKVKESWLLGIDLAHRGKKDNVIPAQVLNILLNPQFMEVESKIQSQFSFIGLKYLQTMQRIYFKLFSLNYTGLQKVFTYINDLSLAEPYMASSGESYSDPKYIEVKKD